MQEVKKGVIDLPVFVRTKKGHAYTLLLEYGISNFFFYTCVRKGWDLKSKGQEVYYINELGKWIPSEYFDVITEFNPN